MKHYKKRFLMLFLCFVIIFANTISALANEPESKLSDTEIAILISRMEQLGIEENAQKGLIQKIINGELLDCYNPEQDKNKINLVIKNPDGSTVQRNIYPDGSVIETCFTPGEELHITPQEISGGEFGSGSGYYYMNGAEISMNSLMIHLFFKADYQGASNNTCKISGYGACYGAMVMEDCYWGTIRFKADYEFRQDGSCSIVKVYDGSYTLSFLAVQSESLEITKKYGKEYDPAIAEFKLDAKSMKDAGMLSFTLKLSVEKLGSVWSNLIKTK